METAIAAMTAIAATAVEVHRSNLGIIPGAGAEVQLMEEF